MSKDQNFKELYGKYLANMLSEQEIRQLFVIISNLSDDEARSLVSDHVLEEYEEAPVENEDERLEQILINLRKYTKADFKKRFFQIKLVHKLLAAAVILLVSLISIYIYLENERLSSLQLITKNSEDIAPGREQAILKLADGSIINLDSLRVGEQRLEQHGVKISRDIHGELIYEQTENIPSRSEVEYNTVITPRGGKYKIILPDGTRVWLNASSSITYPTSFADTDKRNVKLTGEAYFEVNKIIDASKGLQPFIVNTNRQKIEVLGTHFNVNSYADEQTEKTTLLEGSVRLNDHVLLRPGQQGESTIDQLKIKTVDADDFVDWKNDEFNLKGGDFRSTMRKIARWYDVEVIYEPGIPNDVTVGGWISRNKNISSVLSLIQKTGNVHFKLEGRRVIVTR